MARDEKLTPEQADATAEDTISNLFCTASQPVAIPMGTDPVPSPVGKRIRISGIVTDEDGKPVEGVSLGFGGDEVKTDAEGRFTIDGVVGRKT